MSYLPPASAYTTPWIVRIGGAVEPRLRLFCFPYAGGGASVYRLWQRSLPADVEVCAIQLPGRESRFAEPLYHQLTPLITNLAPAVEPLLDRPFVFFGHSLGALIAFELARYLRKVQQPEPKRLLVSARGAPQLPVREKKVHALPEAEFITSLYELGGTPQAVLENRELMEMMSPLLRADFEIYERYIYTAEPPLSYPLIAFGGEQDNDVSLEALLAWQQQTSAGFISHTFADGHFFINTSREQLLPLVQRYLY